MTYRRDLTRAVRACTIGFLASATALIGCSGDDPVRQDPTVPAGGSANTGGTSSGTGAAPGATGGNGTAGTGNGPAPGVECIPDGSICDNSMIQFRSVGPIIDFEEGANTVPGSGTWFKIVPDEQAKEQTENSPEVIELTGVETHSGSTKAAKWEVKGFDIEEEQGASLNLLWINCFEVAQTDGISFWAKTSHDMELKVGLRIPSTATTSSNVGDCEAGCPPGPSTEVDATTEWQEYKIAWEDFNDPAEGTKFPSLTQCFLATTVEWKVQEKAENVTLYLDDIALF